MSSPSTHKLYASEDIASLNIARNIGSVKGWHVTGDYITVGTSNDASVFVYDIALLENPNKALISVIRSPFNHVSITSVFFDSELKAVFVSYDNHCLCIFDVHSGEKIGQLRGVNCKQLFVMNHQLLVAHVSSHDSIMTTNTTATNTTRNSTSPKSSTTTTTTNRSTCSHPQQSLIQIWSISTSTTRPPFTQQQHSRTMNLTLKYSSCLKYSIEISHLSPHTIYLDGNVKKEMPVIVAGFSKSSGGSDRNDHSKSSGGILVLYDLLDESDKNNDKYVKSLVFETTPTTNTTNTTTLIHSLSHHSSQNNKGVYCFSIDQDGDSLDDICMCGLYDGTLMAFNVTQMNPEESRMNLVFIMDGEGHTSSSNSNSNNNNESPPPPPSQSPPFHNSIECIAFDGTLKRVVSGGCEGTICVWSFKIEKKTNFTHSTLSFTLIKSHLNIHDGFVTCMTQCEDKVATGSQDGTIKVFDKMDGSLIYNLDQKHVSCVTHLDFIESHLLLSSSEDGTIKLHVLTK
ncbi:hypothetical protein FDP41_000384 [Naegleria fowleri]|uniref:Uncharacterized protein n=1 Tax=Naegleria fowleri TaxID=5763 RepID=A0A6A5CGS8_NAEFO|nr:uncharacterized protein FDP41_000384 [Naegleria fowleri]KAF0984485.1 hypothetical protein FDP41_000384 [Naegleria fowleri]